MYVSSGGRPVDTDKNGDESCNGMVSGWNALLRRFGICAGKNTGINQIEK